MTAAVPEAIPAGAPEAAGTSQTENASDRVRQKLGVTGDIKPQGSEDIKTQRPDIPDSSEPIDIPDADDLDAVLDAEISEALSTTEVPSSIEPPQHEVSNDEAIATVPQADAEEVGPGSKVTGTVQPHPRR